MRSAPIVILAWICGYLIATVLPIADFSSAAWWLYARLVSSLPG